MKSTAKIMGISNREELRIKVEIHNNNKLN